jgi:hypothetical protein
MFLLVHTLCKQASDLQRLYDYLEQQVRPCEGPHRIILQAWVPADFKCGSVTSRPHAAIAVYLHQEQGWPRAWGQLPSRTQWLGYGRDVLMAAAWEQQWSYDVLWWVDADLCDYGDPRVLVELCTRRTDWSILSAYGVDQKTGVYGDVMALVWHDEPADTHRDPQHFWAEVIPWRRHRMRQHYPPTPGEHRFEGFLSVRHAFGWSTLYRASIWSQTPQQHHFLSLEEPLLCEHSCFQRTLSVPVHICTSWVVKHQ